MIKTIECSGNMNIIFKDYEDRNLALLWSGGCDSTLVLDLLVENLHYHHSCAAVLAITIIHEQFGGDKLLEEKKARDRYMEYLKKKKMDKYVKPLVIVMDSAEIHRTASGRAYVQAPIWIAQVIPYLKDNSILFMGYHSNDDFFNYVNYNAWERIASGMLELFGKDVLFCNPLEFKVKHEILKNLKYRKIYGYTWYCENPVNGKPCQKCTPCLTHSAGLYIMEKLRQIHKVNEKAVMSEICTVSEPEWDHNSFKGK